MDPLQEDERWIDVRGYGDRYQISSLGRVKSKPFVKHGCGRSGPFSYTAKERILKPGFADGYPMVLLQRDKVKWTITVHLLVAHHFLPNPDNLPQVNHKDSDRQNSKLSNLEWVTVKENVLHSYRTGKNSNAGERNSRARLDWEKVRQMRARHAAGETVSELAREYGVMRDTARHIVNNRRWKE